MLSNHVQPLQAEASSELETKKQELEASIVAHSEVGQWYPTCESTSADRVSSVPKISRGTTGPGSRRD